MQMRLCVKIFWCLVVLFVEICLANVQDARFTKAGVFGTEGFWRVRQKSNGIWTFVDPDGKDTFLRAVDHVGGEDAHLAADGSDLDSALVKSQMEAWGFVAQGVRAGNNFKPLFPGIPWMCTVKLGNKSGEGDDPERGLVLNLHVPGTAFPNVFRKGFEEDVFRLARERCAPHSEDRTLVGWCIDNELAFHGRNRGASGRWGLFEAARRKPEGNSARRALDEFLAARGFASPEKATMEAREEFCRLVARRYFDVTTRAIHAADPNHLILGCRFASRYDWTDEEAGKFVDVLTFNCYPYVDLERETVDPAVVCEFRKIHERSGRPLMVTEWSFPACDQGYEDSGPGVGQRFATQTQRAKATEIFARTMAAMPFVAGYSYFMWKDSPAGSREETNYGLVGRDGMPFPQITEMFERLQSPEGIAFARPDGVEFKHEGNKWRLEAVGGLVLSGGIGERELCRISYKGEDFGFATAGMMLNTGVEAPDRREGFVAAWQRIECVTDVRFEVMGDYRRAIRVTGEGGLETQRFAIEVLITLMDSPDRLRFDLISIRNVGAVPLLGIRAMLSHQTPFKEVVDKGRGIDGGMDHIVFGEPSSAEVRSADGKLSLKCVSASKALSGMSFTVDNGGKLHPDVYFAPWFETTAESFGSLEALHLARGEVWNPRWPAFDELRLNVEAK